MLNRRNILAASVAAPIALAPAAASALASDTAVRSATVTAWARKIDDAVEALRWTTAEELAALDRFEASEPQIPAEAEYCDWFVNWGIPSVQRVDTTGHLIWFDGIPARMVDANALLWAQRTWRREAEFQRFIRPRLKALQAYEAARLAARNKSGWVAAHHARQDAEYALDEMVRQILAEAGESVPMVAIGMKGVRALQTISEHPHQMFSNYAVAIGDAIARLAGGLVPQNDANDQSRHIESFGVRLLRRNQRVPWGFEDSYPELRKAMT